jgi:hypothetical protein
MDRPRSIDKDFTLKKFVCFEWALQPVISLFGQALYRVISFGWEITLLSWLLQI